MPKVTIAFAALSAQCGPSTRFVGSFLQRTTERSEAQGMNEKLEAAKRFLGNRYVLSRNYQLLQRHRVTHPVNTRETIQEARERIRQGLI